MMAACQRVMRRQQRQWQRHRPSCACFQRGHGEAPGAGPQVRRLRARKRPLTRPADPVLGAPGRWSPEATRAHTSTWRCSCDSMFGLIPVEPISSAHHWIAAEPPRSARRALHARPGCGTRPCGHVVAPETCAPPRPPHSTTVPYARLLLNHPCSFTGYATMVITQAGLL